MDCIIFQKVKRDLITQTSPQNADIKALSLNVMEFGDGAMWR